MQMPRESSRVLGTIKNLIRSHPVLVTGAGVLLAAVMLAGMLNAGSGELIERAEPVLTTGSAIMDSNAGGAEGAGQALVVDVGGAVQHPGVVELAAGARVADAIAAAGGLTADADVATVNQAAPLVDGSKVTVPRAGEEAVPAAEAGDPQGAGSASAAPSAAGLVNINTATTDELVSLPGVGPATAQAIIEDRAAHGPFSSAEDLMRVSGIGEKRFEKMKSRITI